MPEINKLYMDILDDILNSKNKRDGINKALKRVGEYFELSRAYIFENSENNKYINNTFEWCNDGVSSQIDSLQNISIAKTDFFSLFSGKGNLFICPDISTMSNQICRDALTNQDIKAVAFYRIVSHNKTWGFIGFDDCQNVRESWNDADISDALIYIGKLISINIISEINENNTYELSNKLETEKKKSENLLNSISMGYEILNVTANGTVKTVYCTDSCAGLYGYTPNEYKRINKNIYCSAIYSNDAIRFIRFLTQIVNTGESAQISFRRVTKDGSVLWTNATGILDDKSESKNTVYLFYTEMNEESKLYSQMIEESDTGVFVTASENYEILYANSWLINFFGIENYRNITCYEALFKNDMPCADCTVDKCRKDKYCSSDYHIISNDRYLNISVISIDWKGIPAYLHVARDVTKEKKLDIRNNAIVNNMPGGIIVLIVEKDLSHRLEFVNDEFIELSGITKSEIKRHPMHILNMFSKKDIKFFKFDKNNVPYDSYVTVEAEMKTRKAGNKFVRVSASKIPEGTADRYYFSFLDITDSQLAHKEILEKKKSLDAVIEHSGLMYWEYDTINNTVAVGEKLQKHFSLPALVFGSPTHWLTVYSIIHPQYISVFVSAFSDITDAGKKASVCNVLARSADSSPWTWCRIRLSIIDDSDGKSTGKIICTASDISAEKQMESRYIEEKKLRIQTEKDLICSCMVNLSANTVESVQIDGNFSKSEEKMKYSTNYTEQISHILCDVNLSDDDCNKLTSKSLIQNYKFGKNDFKCQYMARYIGDGRIIMVEVSVRLFSRPDNSDVIALYYTRDITKNFLRNSITDEITRRDYDLEGVIFIKTNQLYRCKFNKNGTLEYEFIKDYDKWISQVFTETRPIDADDEEINNNIIANCPKTVIKKLKNADNYTISFRVQYPGKAVTYEQAIYSYIDRLNSIVSVTRRDITEITMNERKNREQLEKLLRETRAADIAKTNFLSRMSHDMRTPMNGIFGMTALTLDEPGLSDTVRTNLETISSSCKYLLSLINDSLDMNSIESNNIKLNIKPENTSDIVRTVLTGVFQAAMAKDIKIIRNNINAGHNNYVMADAVRLQQIFTNLISNSIKFTPEGGTIKLTIEGIDKNDTYDSYRFTIEDSGVGMSEEFMTHMYEPFAQETNDESGKYAGTGLGLSIVKSLVELMNGTIKVKSTLGKGTTFVVEFTFKRAEKTDVKELKKTDYSALSGANVLLCEDHPINASVVKRLLSKKGVNVDCAENGLLGTDFFASSAPFHYDAVLMDMRMPVMDGTEATKTIRNLNRPDAKTIPIISMTADSGDYHSYSQVNAYISKPFEPERLFQVLNDFINNQKKRNL